MHNVIFLVLLLQALEAEPQAYHAGQAPSQNCLENGSRSKTQKENAPEILQLREDHEATRQVQEPRTFHYAH